MLVKPLALSLVAVLVVLLGLLGARLIDPLVFWVLTCAIAVFAYWFLPKLSASKNIKTRAARKKE